MTFSEQLNLYIDTLDCTAKELATTSNITPAALSRYRTGTRVPQSNSSVIDNLATGICEISNRNGLALSRDEVFRALSDTLEQSTETYSSLSEHFDLLISTLQISLKELSKVLNFDSSYLSRIRNGQRTPANIDLFIHDVCQYITRKYNDTESLLAIASIMECPVEQLTEDADSYFSLLSQWFGSDNTKESQQIGNFLKNLDEFNLDDYIRAIHFDELKVPTVPFHLPTSKQYYGIEQMKQGELDFFKTTALSKSKEDIFMCSDMPMADMAEDVEFGKKWMFGIAACLKKGLRLNIIHNIDRPFHEMMLGLESWIPIYMTGQISPFYLKGITTNFYHHFNYVSGPVALIGECINGYHKDGKYYLTNNKDELKYYKKKAANLLSKATPLMEIYRTDTKKSYEDFLIKSIDESGSRYDILSSLPIYTISRELLEQILIRNEISFSERTEILNYAKEQRNLFRFILNNYMITDEIPELTEAEFKKFPMSLSLSGLFLEKEISYTYEEYKIHLAQTKESAEVHEHYSVISNHTQAFRNIQIQTLQGKWVIISKSKTPVIHFVIHHPKMVHAIENFIVPIVEER